VRQREKVAKVIAQLRGKGLTKAFEMWVEYVDVTRQEHAEQAQKLAKTLLIAQSHSTAESALSIPSPVQVTMTLDMDFSQAGEEGTEQREQFMRDVAADLAKALDAPLDSFVIKKLSAGSVKIDMEIVAHPGLTRTPEDMALDMQKQASDNNSLLRAGKLTRQTKSMTHQVMPSEPVPQPHQIKGRVKVGAGMRMPDFQGLKFSLIPSASGFGEFKGTYSMVSASKWHLVAPLNDEDDFLRKKQQQKTQRAAPAAEEKAPEEVAATPAVVEPEVPFAPGVAAEEKAWMGKGLMMFMLMLLAALAVFVACAEPHVLAEGGASLGTKLSVLQENDLQKQWNDVRMLQNQIEINRKNFRALQSQLKISNENRSGGFWWLLAQAVHVWRLR
jgi:hypothetical protein